MQNYSIGIISGTFDPVHNGHIALAEAALLKLKLSEIYFIPEPKPRVKNPIATINHRKKMLQLAISQNSKLKLLSLSSETFSINNFEELKSIFPKKRIYLIFGSDAYQKSKLWFKPEYSEAYNIYTAGFERDQVARGVSSKKIRESNSWQQLNPKVGNYINTHRLY